MKQSEIERLLPSILRRTAGAGTPLAALLAIMEHLHAPSEDVLRHLDSFFDPRRAPDGFVPYLASWVDLERVLEEPPPARGSAVRAAPRLSTGLGRLRELTASAAFLSRWRGTKYGLLRFLEIATGATEFQVNEKPLDAQGRRRPFHMIVSAPETLRAQQSLITRIIEQEKPAYVTFDLEFVRPQTSNNPESM
ncbi:MAG: repeat domain protein [Bryobacterales bacterium]|nr:repeat domain protein [Bryobacterales bacterium]